MAEHLDYLKLRAVLESVSNIALDNVVQRALARKQRPGKPQPVVEAVKPTPKPQDQPLTSAEISAVAGEIEVPAGAPPVVEELPSVIVEEQAPAVTGEAAPRVEEQGAPGVEEGGAPKVEEPGEPTVEAEMAPTGAEMPTLSGTPEPTPYVEESGVAEEAEFVVGLPSPERELIPEERAALEARRQERERVAAREELERTVHKLAALQAQALVARTTLRQYYDQGKVNDKIRTPEGAAEHQRAYSDLARLDPEALVAIANPPENQRAAILGPEAPKSEIQLAQEKLESAREQALRTGLSEEEVARIIEPATERPAGLVDQPPTPQPGETPEQYLEKWELWKDALKSGGKAVPKIVWGVASTLLGVRLAETGIRFGWERWQRRKAKKSFTQMTRGLEEVLRRGTGAPEAEYETAFGTLIQKMQELEKRLDALVGAGKLKSEDRENILDKIREEIARAQGQAPGAQDTLNQTVERTLHDYFQTKVSKVELGKQTFNTAFLLAGVQTARALGYGAFTALARAMRGRKEYEQKIKLEGRPADFWERERAVWQNLVPRAAQEYASGISGIWADLFTGRRVSRTEWAQKKMAFGKALSTTFIFAGLTKVAHAEMSETGFSMEAQINQVLDALEKRGIGATLGNNWLHNLEQLSFGWIKFKPLTGDLQIAQTPEQGHADHTPVPPKEVPKTPDDHVQTTVEVEGAIQQEVRNIVTALLVKAKGGNEFNTLDATHVENAVANLTLLLKGKDLRFLPDDHNADWFNQEIAHLGIKQIIIKDTAGFHDFVVNTLLKHASDKITAENLARYDEAVATTNNTSDSNWQHDVNVGTGVEKAGTAGYVKVNIDHEFVHQAEVGMARHEAAEFTEATGIKVQVDPRDVENESNYTMRTAELGQGQAIPVVDGHADILISYVERQPYVFDLPESFKVDHPYFADNLKANLALAQEQALEAAGAHAPPETTPLAAEALPHTFSELVKISKAQGGWVGSDGYVHLGEVKFPPALLERIGKVSTEAFVNNPWEVAGIPWYARFSDNAHAVRALVNTLEKHFDPGPEKVGDQIIRYQDDFNRWMRSVPKELGPGEDIGGV